MVAGLHLYRCSSAGRRLNADITTTKKAEPMTTNTSFHTPKSHSHASGTATAALLVAAALLVGCAEEGDWPSSIQQQNNDPALISRSLETSIGDSLAKPTTESGSNIPPLQASSTCDSSDPEVFVIEHLDDWDRINDPAYRIFCIKPGDYRAKGAIRLTLSGSENAPRYIKLDAPSGHPKRLTESQQAFIDSVELIGASYWRIERLTIADVSHRRPVIHLQEGSTNNVIDSMRIENFYDGIMIEKGSHKNLIQNNLIGDMKFYRGGDGVCIGLQAWRNRYDSVKILDTQIINNEIYDCNDGIQAIANDYPYDVDFSGTLIEGNHIYLTSSRYSDCSGNLDPDGNCACAENAIDLKGGAENANNPVRLKNNKFWGWRQTDTQCGGSGSWGAALVAHMKVKNVIIENNTVFDSPRGFSFVGTAHDITVRNNILHGINNAIGNGYTLVATNDTYNLNYVGNTIADSDSWAAIYARTSTVQCNTVINSQKASAAIGAQTVVGNNIYFGTSPWEGAGGNMTFGTAEDAHTADLCFEIKPISGSTTMCLTGVQPTSSTPTHPDC